MMRSARESSTSQRGSPWCRPFPWIAPPCCALEKASLSLWAGRDVVRDHNNKKLRGEAKLAKLCQVTPRGRILWFGGSGLSHGAGVTLMHFTVAIRQVHYLEFGITLKASPSWLYLSTLTMKCVARQCVLPLCPCFARKPCVTWLQPPPKTRNPLGKMLSQNSFGPLPTHTAL